jgi:hypothetical protein
MEFKSAGALLPIRDRFVRFLQWSADTAGSIAPVVDPANPVAGWRRESVKHTTATRETMDLSIPRPPQGDSSFMGDALGFLPSMHIAENACLSDVRLSAWRPQCNEDRPRGTAVAAGIGDQPAHRVANVPEMHPEIEKESRNIYDSRISETQRAGNG